MPAQALRAAAGADRAPCGKSGGRAALRTLRRAGRRRGPAPWRRRALRRSSPRACRRQALRGPAGRGRAGAPEPRPGERRAPASCAALDGEPQAFLLHGVTGSGKTEVYIRAVREALLRGKGAILLVPEIALTPQMVSWFRARFGDVAAVLHSALSQGEKYDEWRRHPPGRGARGHRRALGGVCAGGVPGLLIVDEEHEGTYRSGTHPCYDAREVARVRCRLQGATLVLGSATPSVETYARTLRGHNVLLEMRERVGWPAAARGRDRGHAQGAHRGQPEHVLPRAARRHRGDAARRPAGGPVPQPARALQLCQVPRLRLHGPLPALRRHHDLSLQRRNAQVPLLRRGLAAAQDLPACGSPFIRRFGVGTRRWRRSSGRSFPPRACCAWTTTPPAARTTSSGC